MPTIYHFPGEIAESVKTKQVLGGKGYGLVTMTESGLPVPPGFVIPTLWCERYQQDADDAEAELRPMVEAGLKTIDSTMKIDGSLVSVRSGAPVSMPGMMDTILNVRLTSATLPDWRDMIGQAAADDCMRRLIEMLGVTAMGADKEALHDVMAAAGVHTAADFMEMSADARVGLCKVMMNSAETTSDKKFPRQSGLDQVMLSIRAVMTSWHNERARLYREMYGIPEDMGTACVVQAMVFGNMNERSGSGVFFTRNPSDGDNMITGEFLPVAQGEDVVNGSSNPLELGALDADEWSFMDAIVDLSEKLEAHYGDVQDVEFTVQDGELFILQTRNAKREAAAAFRIVYDLLHEGVIDEGDLTQRLTYGQYEVMKRPRVTEVLRSEDFTGLPACSGAVVGRVVFSMDDVANLPAGSTPVLFAKETTPDDLALMKASGAVVTSTGGATCHAAVVARGMDLPCVVGCQALTVLGASATHSGGVPVSAGVYVAVDGATGRVWVGQEGVKIGDGAGDPYLAEIVQALLSRAEGVLPVSEHGDAERATAVVPDHATTGDVLPLMASVKYTSPAEGTVLFLDRESRLGAHADVVVDFMMGADFQRRDTEKLFSEALELYAADLRDRITVVPGEFTDVESLVAAGYKVIRGAATVADVMAGLPVTPDFIKNVLGSQDVLEQLAKAGLVPKQSAEVMTAAPEGQIVADVLGG